jgi:hypothetical protein
MGFTLGVVCPAGASDWFTGAPRPAARDMIVAIDGSVGVTSTGGRDAHLSATTSLDGTLSRDGTRLRVEAGAGTSRSVSQGVTADGRFLAAAVMGGYEWVRPNLSVAGYAGVEVRTDDSVRGLVGSPRTREDGVGLKLAANVWSRPIAGFTLHGFGSFSTIRNGYYGRFRAGWDVLDGAARIGPELVVLGDDTFRQWRLGGHVSGIALGSLTLGVSAGLVNDSSGRSGVYAGLDMRAGF